MRRIPIAEPEITPQDIETVDAKLRAGAVSGKARFVEEFEGRFAKWIGARYAIATTNGTAALHLALMSVGIKPNDELLIPAFSMAAIPFSIHYAGAKGVLIDSEGSTWNIDSNKIERKITARTKAIFAMHTYGHPVDLNPILEIARRRNTIVIEDAAEAHGAEYKGRKVGSIGDIGCFSFYANKIITTGEGGMVVTSSQKIADRAKLLRDMAFGQTPATRYVHELVGYNYRLSGLLAGLGESQLLRIERYITKRRANAKLYSELLADVKGITLPPEAEWAKSVFWMYSILINPKKFGVSRGGLILRLQNRGVETRPFFVPVHKQPAFKKEYVGENYPWAERLGRTGLNLPSGNTLEGKEIEYVASQIASIGKRAT